MNKLQTKAKTLDSREVAQMVNKRHADLIRDIEKYMLYGEKAIERKIALNEFFIKSSYKDSIGRTLPCYQITEKGCEFIAHKMTGEKGAQFTFSYINRFHEMEKDLTENKPAPVEELTTKYYRGQPVVTISDIALVSGKSPFEIRYHVNNALIRGTDYYFLTGNELDKFKDENKSISRMASSLIVINKQGFIKLVKVMQGIPQLPCFKNALPEPKQVPRYTYDNSRVAIRINDGARKLLKELHDGCIAMNEVIDLMHENQPLETHEHCRRTLHSLLRKMQRISPDLSIINLA